MKKRKNYTRGLKEEAVKLTSELAYRVTDVA